MERSTLVLAVWCGVTVAAQGVAQGGVEVDAPRVEDVFDAFEHGEFGGRIRYRFDTIDIRGFEETARASTARAALHFETAPLHGFTGFLEVYTNESIGEDAFNGITNGKPAGVYPVIPDPEGAGVNRGWVKFEDDTFGGGLTVKVGRQFVHWNDGRILTNAFYRQNQNTFDALSVNLEPASGLELTYAYLWRHQDVFFREFDMDSHAAQIAWTVPDRIRLSGYATLLDYAGPSVFDRNTFGVRATGPWRLSDETGIHYVAEFAHQSDASGNPFDVDANYIMAELGIVHGKVLAYLGYNRSDGVRDGTVARPFDQLAGFPYPYRGESERFVPLPTAGVEALMLRATGPVPTVPGLKWLVHVHRFGQEAGSLNFGTDVGIQANYTPEGSSWSTFCRVAQFFQDDAAAGFRDSSRFVFGAELRF